MAFKFYMPAKTLMGVGCLGDLSEEVKELKVKKALLVTDKTLCDIGLVDKVTKVLKDGGTSVVIYNGTKPNPTVTNVNEGLELFKKEKCDIIVSVGGGSPTDCAKGVALVLSNGGKIEDYDGVNLSSKPQFPLIAINTTAGTASEMTIASIITNEERRIKMVIFDKNVLPMIAVNDPELMVDMPKGLTAATGMDALTHAVEAYVSKGGTPITYICALGAVKLIANNLKNAVDNGKDIVARDNMAYGEYLAGMAFSNGGLGYVHAMAHQLGAQYDLPHGVCNAVLLPHVQEFNSKVASEKLKDIAEAMGVDVSKMSNEEGAKSAVSAIKKLANEIGIPKGLEELKVKKEDFDHMVKNALVDATAGNNPVVATAEEIKGIFNNAF